MYYRHILILILCCFFSSISPSYSQTKAYSITGQLIDSQNKESLPFATVRVFNVSDSSLVTGETSDINGRFAISAPKGSFYIWIDFVGYKRKQIAAFQLNEGNKQLKLGELLIAPNTEMLDEVEVTGTRMQAEYQLDKRVYNVGNDVANIGANASLLLDNLPSVTVDVVEGTISLRGSQNVRVLIDGKPAALSGMSSAEALRNLQSDMIERVEVVTNPSARYDAEGEAGVINIVLKKNRRKGVNGSFNANLGFPMNTGASASINYRKNSFNFFGSYGVSYRKTPGGGSSLQRFIEEDTSYYYERTRDHDRESFSQNARIGLDYYITPTFSVTASANLNYSDEYNEVLLNYYDYSGEDVLTQEVGRQQYETETDESWGVGVSLKKEFERKGHTWTFDWNWSDDNELELADLFEQNRTFASIKDITQYSSNLEAQNNWFVQTDYIRPFADKGQIEMGVRGTSRVIDNEYLVEEELEDGSFEPLPDFNNNFKYDEDIWASYFIIGNGNDRISWQLGLRGEYTLIGTELTVTNEQNTQEYFGLFPSAFLSYNFDKQTSVQLSYSRRLSRPRFRWLLPFSNFSDSRNFRAGNPNLRPEYTNSFEVGFLENWDAGSILTSVYYRHRTDIVQRITRVVNGDETISQPVNLAVQHAIGLEIAWSQDITNWWSLDANTNLYREETQGNYEGESLNAETFTMSGRASSRLKYQGFNFQTSFRYRAPRQTPQGRRKAVAVMDFGVARDLWEGKGTLSLSVRDLFNSRRWRSVIDTPTYYSESDFQWRARQVMLSFSYRLNQKKSRRGGGSRDDDGGEY